MFGAEENFWLYLKSEIVVFVLDYVFEKNKSEGKPGPATLPNTSGLKNSDIDCTFLLWIFAFTEGKQADRMHEFMKHLVLPLMHSCQKKKKNNASLNFIPCGCFLMVQHAEISFILGVCHLYCVTWAQHPI